MSYGWRCWLAFEVRPGITVTTVAPDRGPMWRALANQCVKSNGKIDRDEYQRWMDLIIDHGHLWGSA